MRSKRKLSYAFKVAIIICCLTGILSNLLRTSSVKSMLSFYTMQSNILVLIFYLLYFIVTVINPEHLDSPRYYKLKGATVMAITLTFLTYTISLQPLDFAMDYKQATSNIFRFSNLFVHFLVPIFVILDYLLFDEKGHFRRRYLPMWCFFPTLYPVYVYTYAANGGKFFSTGGSKEYAYFFLDIDKIGMMGVASYMLLFLICYVITCLALIHLDKFLRKHNPTYSS